MTKTANEQNMRDINIDDGRMLVNTMGTGLALGAGAVGIHHILKQLRERMRRKPRADENIYAPVYSDLPPVKQANNIYESVLETIGKTFMPKKIPTIVPGGSGKTEPMSAMHWAGRAILPATAGAAGAGIGALSLQKLIQSRREAARSRGAAESVSSARKAYFDALLGNEPEENEKQSSAALNKKLGDLFHHTKMAEPGARAWYNPMRLFGDYIYEPGVGLPLALCMGSMGIGGLYGGVLAYKRRKAESQRKANAAAEEARTRLRGISPPWIDPKELAALKQLNVNAQ